MPTSVFVMPCQVSNKGLYPQRTESLSHFPSEELKYEGEGWISGSSKIRGNKVMRAKQYLGAVATETAQTVCGDAGWRIAS